MGGVKDEILREIAKNIPNSKVPEVGLGLNLERPEVDRFQISNQINGVQTCNGTWAMLQAWKDNTKEEDQQMQLKRALEKAKLTGVADQFFRQKIHTNDLEPESTLTLNNGSEPVRMTPNPGLGGTPPGFVLYYAESGWWDSAEGLYSAEGLFWRLSMLQSILEDTYTDSGRFLDGFTHQERTFPVELAVRSPFHELLSRHDIFNNLQSNEGCVRKRIIVSGERRKNTALSHVLAYDWATQNRSSSLSKEQLVFEISAHQITADQTIAAAIKQQLFSGVDEIDEHRIQQILEAMPDAVILFDGFNGKHIRNYGENVMKVLRGHELKDVTVMVTAEVRSAQQLHRLAPNLYVHIDMQ